MDIRIIGKMEDGTALGEKDGQLYIGKPKKVGFDELEEVVKVSKDGKTIESTIRYGDHIHAQGTYTRDAFIEQAITRLADAQVVGEDGKTRIANDEEKQKMALKEWEMNLTPQKQKKQTMAALDTNGDIIEVEKKITVYEWSKK